ncbi:hypothetical protein BV25DRAFT_1530428 [Artomyces pyxidatus]|uniref:Uncharacterized protein n=1 Tax=Artomyces pyxidatus TaxID=48021 RepID=A0ACB8TD93_9AGAM|nr:hypothetical protein BV25DRAFT_1530428 [Artomyces pyxidatus]
MIYSPPSGPVAVSPLTNVGSPASFSTGRMSSAKSVLSVSSAKTTINQYIGRTFPQRMADSAYQRQLPFAGVPTPEMGNPTMSMPEEGSSRRSSHRPRKILSPAPVGPGAEQLVPQPQNMQIITTRHRDPDLPVHSKRDRVRTRRSRSSSSDSSITITVRPPSTENTPSPYNTVTSLPVFLSPDHPNRPLPTPTPPRTLTPPSELGGLPPGFVPMGSSSSTASSAAPYTRSRTLAYEAAPIPSGVHYPASLIAQAKDELAPLSPLASTGFVGFVPKKFGWTRNMADK